MAEVYESIKCPNCGAPLSITPGELVLTCEFCGSDVNTATGAKYVFKHSIIAARHKEKDAVIPFVKSWMRSGFLKPPDLSRKSKIVDMELSLLPFFVFRLKASTVYHGYLTRTGAQQERKGVFEKECYWKILARRDSIFPVAEYVIPLQAKAPFALSFVPPSASFLNGELDEGAAKDMARQEIDSHHRHLLSDAVDTFTSTETKLDVLDTEFIHAPLWHVKYQYGSRMYDMVLDAVTGSHVWATFPTSREKKGLFRRR